MMRRFSEGWLYGDQPMSNGLVELRPCDGGQARPFALAPTAET